MSTLIPVILGSIIIIITQITVLNKTIKKMGYGSIGYYKSWPSSRWPNNYYSNFYWNKIKPEFKQKVEKWNQEFKKIRKGFIIWYILGILCILAGFSVFFYLLFYTQLCYPDYSNIIF